METHPTTITPHSASSKGSVFDPNSEQKQKGTPQIKQITGYPNYTISSDGIVRRICGSPIYAWIANKYVYVRLINEHGLHIDSIHRLVATHFLANPNNLRCVCHKDDDPTNNSVDNLFWGSHTDNMQDMISKGRKVNSYGSDNGSAVLSADQVQFIRAYPGHRGHNRLLAEMFNVSQPAITHIRKGTTWKNTKNTVSSTK